MITSVGVEKVTMRRNGLKLGDQKCMPSRRSSFIGHPSAASFQRSPGKRVFQQPRPLSFTTWIGKRREVWGHLPEVATTHQSDPKHRAVIRGVKQTSSLEEQLSRRNTSVRLRFRVSGRWLGVPSVRADRPIVHAAALSTRLMLGPISIMRRTNRWIS